MDEPDRRRFNVARLWGSAPWMRPTDVRHFSAKVFKSGNSLALRLPAALGLAAGMEMDLRMEDGTFSFELKQPSKRKFDIAKVAGSARDLQFLTDEDRLFEERPLDSTTGGSPGGDAES